MDAERATVLGPAAARGPSWAADRRGGGLVRPSGGPSEAVAGEVGPDQAGRATELAGDPGEAVALTDVEVFENVARELFAPQLGRGADRDPGSAQLLVDTELVAAGEELDLEGGQLELDVEGAEKAG